MKYEVTVFNIRNWKRVHYGYAETAKEAARLMKGAKHDQKSVLPVLTQLDEGTEP